MNKKVSKYEHGDNNRIGYSFYCEGCKGHHGVPVDGKGRPNWTFNGDEEKPTFAPSILVTYEYLSDAGREKSQEFYKKHGRYPTNEELPYDSKKICHSFVRDGKIQYLGDCTHSLKGQTIDLPNIDLNEL